MSALKEPDRVEIEFLRENPPFRPGERISVSFDRALVYESAKAARRVFSGAGLDDPARGGAEPDPACGAESDPARGAGLGGKRAAVVRDYVKKT